MAELLTIHDLLTAELKDLYSAEQQLTKAIPKMAEETTNRPLREAFEHHLLDTHRQVERLERAADILGIRVGGKKCRGMEGIIAEGDDAIGETGEPALVHLGMVSAACRVEQYEMAGYRTAIALAEEIGEEDIVELLEESLAEEEAAEAKLRRIAAGLLADAAEAESEETPPTDTLSGGGMLPLMA